MALKFPIHLSGRRHGPLCKALIINGIHKGRGIAAFFWSKFHALKYKYLIFNLLQNHVWHRPALAMTQLGILSPRTMTQRRRRSPRIEI